MGRVVLGSEGEGPWGSCASSGCCQDGGGHGRELLRNTVDTSGWIPNLRCRTSKLNSIIKRRTTDFQMMTWIRKDARHEGMSCRLGRRCQLALTTVVPTASGLICGDPGHDTSRNNLCKVTVYGRQTMRSEGFSKTSLRSRLSRFCL